MQPGGLTVYIVEDDASVRDSLARRESNSCARVRDASNQLMRCSR